MSTNVAPGAAAYKAAFTGWVPANRRTSMSSPGAISSTYVWDQTTGGSFGIGRLSGASVAADSVGYVYDAQGRVTSQAVAITDSGHASPFTVGYAYDANGRVIQVTYPSGDVVNLTRTTDGLVTAVTETLAGGGAAQPIATNVAFEPFGPLAGLTYGSGLVLTRAYDQDYQLTGLSTAPASGPALLNVTFAWQPDARIAGITDHAGTGRGAAFGYTAAGRVSTANGPWGAQSFAYDPNGNQTSANLPSAATPASATYAYDGFKRLKTVVQGSQTLSYAYDYLGRNVWSSGSGSAVAFIYDTEGRLIAEHDAATGAMQREYVWIEDKLIGIVDNAGGTPSIEAVTTGQIDEPLLVTAPDQSMLLDGYVDPYGNQGLLQATSYTLNQRLPGQLYQQESGLSQNGWRDYDPAVGRYIEADPIGIDGGQNLYGYVGGDPLNRRDPMGLQAVNPLEATCVDPAQPACWAGLALGALGVYEAGQAANALSNSQSKSKAGFCPTPNDDCKKLVADIYQAMEHVENSAAAMAIDKNGLFTRAFSTPMPSAPRLGTWTGHATQLAGWRNRLKNLINQADAKGCPVPPGAREAANLGTPLNPMGRF